MQKPFETERNEQLQPKNPAIAGQREAPADRTGHSCSLCGQLYHSFAFKGGYICEDCLQSIKDPQSASKPPSKDA